MPQIRVQLSQLKPVTSEEKQAVDKAIDRKILLLKMHLAQASEKKPSGQASHNGHKEASVEDQIEASVEDQMSAARSATIAGKVRLLKDKELNQSDPTKYANRASAREDLRNLAQQLASGGKVASGYLSLSKDGSTVSNTTFGGGRAAATARIRGLVEAAYGDALRDKGMNEKDAQASIGKIIDDYLARSGNKFGTRSLVALVKKLEDVSGNDPKFLAQVNVGSKRIAIETLTASPLPKNSQEAWQKINNLFSSQRDSVTRAEREAVETEFVAATCKTVNRTSATYGRNDFDISGFIDLKIKERLATDRGMTAADFMALVKTQAPDTLIGKDAADHPNAQVRDLHSKLVKAMRSAETLDEFYNLASASIDETRKKLPFVDDFHLRHAAEKALKQIRKSQSPELISPFSPFSSGQKQAGAMTVDMPNLHRTTSSPGRDDLFGSPAGANDLFRFGVSLLTATLDLYDKETGQAQGKADSRASQLISLITRAASEATPDLSDFDRTSKIFDFEDELNTLLGDQARPDNALGFGKDCLIRALWWRDDHIVPIVGSAAEHPSDHPIIELEKHPYVKKS